MKKKNLKSLMLHKNLVSNLTEVNGGKAVTQPSLVGICPVESKVLTCEPEICNYSDTCISVPNGTNCCPL